MQLRRAAGLQRRGEPRGGLSDQDTRNRQASQHPPAGDARGRQVPDRRGGRGQAGRIMHFPTRSASGFVLARTRL